MAGVLTASERAGIVEATSAFQVCPFLQFCLRLPLSLVPGVVRVGAPGASQLFVQLDADARRAHLERLQPYIYRSLRHPNHYLTFHKGVGYQDGSIRQEDV